MQARFGNAPRGFLSIRPRPPREQPFRHVGRDRIEGRQDLRALVCDLAQDGVRELVKALGLWIALRLFHREIDGGVTRRAEQQELGCAAQQDQLGAACLTRQRSLQKTAEHRREAPAIAQHCRGQEAREGPIACRQLTLARAGLRGAERLVERLAAPEHVVENIDGHHARFEPRRWWRSRRLALLLVMRAARAGLIRPDGCLRVRFAVAALGRRLRAVAVQVSALNPRGHGRPRARHHSTGQPRATPLASARCDSS